MTLQFSSKKWGISIGSFPKMSWLSQNLNVTTLQRILPPLGYMPSTVLIKVIHCTQHNRTGCRDDSRYRRYCPRWLSAGFCDHPQHGKTLRRRCKKTCGFCPGTSARTINYAPWIFSPLWFFAAQWSRCLENRVRTKTRRRYRIPFAG